MQKFNEIFRVNRPIELCLQSRHNLLDNPFSNLIEIGVLISEERFNICYCLEYIFVATNIESVQIVKLPLKKLHYSTLGILRFLE